MARSGVAPEGGRALGVGLTTATIRAILSADTDDGGRAEQIAQRLSQAIRLGLILDGEQLPPEAELARRLGVAPVTLRESLAALREDGLVTTKRGRDGGTFARMPVDDGGAGAPPRLVQFSTHTLRELGDHRTAVAGTAAYLAAERAVAEELDDLATQVARLRAASTPSERRRADTQLSIEIAAAAQSARLTRAEQEFRVEIGDLLWQPLTADELDAALDACDRLVTAITAREAHAARAIAEERVAADTRRLVSLRLELARR